MKMQNSDIVMLMKDGKIEYYYVDPFCFARPLEFGPEDFAEDKMQTLLFDLYDELMATGAWMGHAYAFEIMKIYFVTIKDYMKWCGMDPSRLENTYENVIREFNALAEDTTRSFMNDDDTRELEELDNSFLDILAQEAQKVANRLGITEIRFAPEE